MAERGRGEGARALGGPINVMVWLANQQSKSGRGGEVEVAEQRREEASTPCASMTSKVTPSTPGAPSLSFASAYAQRSVSMLQTWTYKPGGITEIRKIIPAAEAHSIELVPHCAYFGPGNLVSIHIVATLATDTSLETSTPISKPVRSAMLCLPGMTRCVCRQGRVLASSPTCASSRNIATGRPE
jgi:Enolase C-terminal domain-like